MQLELDESFFVSSDLIHLDFLTPPELEAAESQDDGPE